jgi:inorganic phosphate transporter, PiT family
MVFLLVALSLVYAFLNGYRDSSCILAGVIASRAVQPRLAIYLVALADLIAPFLFGLAVARSLATGLVNPSAISMETIVIAMVSALAWILFCWRRGIPSSSTHALVGGLLGATLITSGPEAIFTSGLIFIVLPLLLAPLAAFSIGFVLMRLLLFAFNNATPRINTSFRRLQGLTMVLLAASNSSNDAQKSMGVIAMGLILAGKTASFTVPLWVLISCSAALAFGASRGDWRQIRQLGGKMYPIRPVNALDSHLASIGLILSASVFGIPVSTPHIISSSLLGAGASERMNKVRWQTAGAMVTTWIVTIPATMAVSLLIFFALIGLRGLGRIV